MSTASHPEPAQAGSQPSDVSPQSGSGQRLFGCARCMTRTPTKGARRWLHLGRVCAGCDDILRGTSTTEKRAADGHKFTACPAKGIAAGFDPRTQLPPGAQIVGAFTRDWLAKRAAA